MAEIGIIEKFYALHGSNLHGHDFRIEVVLEGKIDPTTEFVNGVDHYKVISELKKIISAIKNNDLKQALTEAGFKSSGNESIARFFLSEIKNKYPVKYIRVWETESRYATVYKNEV
jgi:6-pyruvoyl-tetrahydropterin synthase